MNELTPIILSFLAGLGFGWFYFAGLWFTVKRAFTSQRSALIFIGSFIVRASVILTGLYFVSGGQFPRIAGYLVGFLLARFVLTQYLKPGTDKNLHSADASPGKEMVP